METGSFSEERLRLTGGAGQLALCLHVLVEPKGLPVSGSQAFHAGEANWAGMHTPAGHLLK